MALFTTEFYAYDHNSLLTVQAVNLCGSCVSDRPECLNFERARAHYEEMINFLWSISRAPRK